MSTHTIQPTRKPPPPNALSLLLSNEENENVFRALKPRCQSQATAVVEVYGTVSPNHNGWTKIGVGVAVFIKDNTRRSYFIQVFDNVVCTQQNHNIPPLLLEQEIYREFSYNESKEFFHQFEGDERMIGLNFAAEEEARLFCTAVENLLTGRMKKREERKREAMLSKQKLMLQQQQEQHHQEKVERANRRQQQQQEAKMLQQAKSSKYKTIRGMKKLMDKYGNPYKEKPRKIEIGRPTDFKHVSHAGLDSAFNVNEDIEELLKHIGIDNTKMSEPKTQRYVMDFIENVGGIDEVRKMNRRLSTKLGVEPVPYPPQKYRQNSTSRVGHILQEAEEDEQWSSTCSSSVPPPEAPPALPPEYSSYRPPLPPRDQLYGANLASSFVPSATQSIPHHTAHSKAPSLYTTKATANDGNQRFPTTPSGRQLPIRQNTASAGNSRPSATTISKTGMIRTPSSPSNEGFSNYGIIPPSPPTPRGLGLPASSMHSSSRAVGLAISPGMPSSYGTSQNTLMGNGKRALPTSPISPSNKATTLHTPETRGKASTPVPPPMPAGTGSAPTPPPMPSSSGPAPIPPPMPSGRGPVPIPPPLPTGGEATPSVQRGKGSAPPPPPMPKTTQNPPDQRSALLEQIRSGHALKTVSAQPARKEVPLDARSEMLEKIRTGVTLTHVDTSELKNDESDAPVKLEGWALDLHNALVKREQFIQSSDDSDQEDEDDDDEWDDSE